LIIRPSAVNLGYILRSIPHSSFKMDTFNDRLRLQKLVYMVEAFGVYLGYDYSWYLRGPYCTSLARAGFELEQIDHKIPDLARAKFMYPEVQKKFNRAIKFIAAIMNGPDDLTRLEIASSLHLLVATNARPAFVQSPSSIALLKPEERKEQIIIDVVKQYG